MLGGKESGNARCGDGSLSGFRWQSGWDGEWLLRFESRGRHPLGVSAIEGKQGKEISVGVLQRRAK